MITRVYINNFRCLVNFELKLNSFGVLCGANGSGKSSVYDALLMLQNLGAGNGVLGGTGELDTSRLELTEWLDSKTQEFELDFDINGNKFRYAIHFEQKADYEKPRIIFEKATCDGIDIFTRNLDGVLFTKLDGEHTGFPLDWHQTALSAINPLGSTEKVKLLQKAVANLIILRPDPRSMKEESRDEAKYPDMAMINLTSWYRSLYQEQEWADALRDSLQGVWSDFRSFKLVDVGLNAKALQLRFETDDNQPVFLFFDQLSDGERAIVALYMIRASVQTGAVHTVFIDEPDNFVGLPELQPWVLSMLELLDESCQLIVISHHPEILSYAGETNALYFWRDNHISPTRTRTLKVFEGMTVGEAIARGWTDG